MPKQYRPREVEIIVRRLGWEYSHHTGSHAIYRRQGHSIVVIPEHRGDVRPGTLRSICRGLGISRQEFDRIALEVL